MQLFQPLKFQRLEIFFSPLKLFAVEDTWLIFLCYQIFHDFSGTSAFKMALNFWMSCMKITYLNDLRLQIISSVLFESLIAC